MPDSLWAEILEGQDTIGAMERLKSELSGWIQKRDIYYNGLLELFLNDSVYSSDSITDLLQYDFNLISRYDLILYYLNRSDFTQADNILQNIPNEFTLRTEDQVICQDFSVLIQILEQLSNDTFSYIAPDSIQIISLLSLVEGDYAIPGVFARNVLLEDGYLEYHEPILLETTLKSGRLYRKYGKNVHISSDFKAYPNPCKDYIILEYTKRPEDVLTIEIMNVKANAVASYSYKKPANQVIIPFSQYPPGTYLLHVYLNGSLKKVSKIIHY
jgi:hypothetical protein